MAIGVLAVSEERQRRVALLPESLDRRLRVYQTMTGLDFQEIIRQALSEFLDERSVEMTKFLEDEARRMRGHDR